MARTLRIGLVAAAAAAVLGLASGSASAQLKVGGGGVDVVGPATTPASVQPDPGLAIVRDTRRTGGHTLRCWQHGRLLYEGAGFRGSLGTVTNAITVPRRSGDGDGVTVINLNDAFCMLADG